MHWTHVFIRQTNVKNERNICDRHWHSSDVFQIQFISLTECCDQLLADKNTSMTYVSNILECNVCVQVSVRSICGRFTLQKCILVQFDVSNYSSNNNESLEDSFIWLIRVCNGVVNAENLTRRNARINEWPCCATTKSKYRTPHCVHILNCHNLADWCSQMVLHLNTFNI